MEFAFEYIKPDFLVIVAALFILGRFLKQIQKLPNKYIPIILSGIGIIISSLNVIGTCEGCEKISLIIYDSITQGILCAGMAVYSYEVIKHCTGPDCDK